MPQTIPDSKYMKKKYHEFKELESKLKKSLESEKKNGSYSRVIDLEGKLEELQNRILLSTLYMDREDIKELMFAYDVPELWINKRHFECVSNTSFKDVIFEPESQRINEWGYIPLIFMRASFSFLTDFFGIDYDPDYEDEPPSWWGNNDKYWKKVFDSYDDRFITSFSNWSSFPRRCEKDIYDMLDNIQDFKREYYNYEGYNDGIIYINPHSKISDILRVYMSNKATRLVNRWIDSKKGRSLKSLYINVNGNNSIVIDKLLTLDIKIVGGIVKFKCTDNDYFIGDWIKDRCYGCDKDNDRSLFRIRTCIKNNIMNYSNEIYMVIARRFYHILLEGDYAGSCYFEILTGFVFPQSICDIMCMYMEPLIDKKREVLAELSYTIRDFDDNIKNTRKLISNSFHINDLDSSNSYSKQELRQMKRELIRHLRKSIEDIENLDLSGLDNNDE